MDNTPEQQETIDLVRQIGKAISVANKVPTQEEVATAMGLIPNVAGGYIRTREQLEAFVTQYMLDNPATTLTNNDVKSIITAYNEANNVVPTQAEIATALNLTVVNNQSALNFTTEQVRAIVASELALDESSGQRPINEIKTIIGTYITNHNIAPTLQEITDALNLTVVNNQTALNFTTEQVRGIVTEYITANPELIGKRTDDALKTFIESTIVTFSDTNNEVPTLEEISQALDLDVSTVRPLAVFSIKSFATPSNNEIMSLINEKITVLNNTASLLPDRDLVYVFNKTVPITDKLWFNDIQYTIPNIEDIIYLDSMEKVFINNGTNIQKYDLDFNSEKVYDIVLTSLQVSIDAQRIVGLNSDGDIVVYEYNKTTDSYALHQTIILTVKATQVSMDTVGEYLHTSTLDSSTVYTYKINRSTEGFELLDTFNATVPLRRSIVSLDNNTMYAITTNDTLFRFQWDIGNSKWSERGIQTLKSILGGSVEDTTLSNIDGKHAISIDGNRLLLSSNTDSKLYAYFTDGEIDNQWVLKGVVENEPLGGALTTDYGFNLVYAVSKDNGTVYKYRALR